MKWTPMFFIGNQFVWLISYTFWMFYNVHIYFKPGFLDFCCLHGVGHLQDGGWGQRARQYGGWGQRARVVCKWQRARVRVMFCVLSWATAAFVSETSVKTCPQYWVSWQCLPSSAKHFHGSPVLVYVFVFLRFFWTTQTQVPRKSMMFIKKRSGIVRYRST